MPKSVPVNNYTNEGLLALLIPSLPDLDYSPYLKPKKKNKIVEFIRSGGQTKLNLIMSIIIDIGDAIFEDELFPTGLLGAIFLVKKIWTRQKRRRLYRKVARSLLEKIFDPALRFIMTEDQIEETFEAHGIPADLVNRRQKEKIYAIIIERLSAGELRDIIHREGLVDYVDMKISEIRWCKLVFRMERVTKMLRV